MFNFSSLSRILEEPEHVGQSTVCRQSRSLIAVGAFRIQLTNRHTTPGARERVE